MIDSHSNYHSNEDRLTEHLNSPQIIQQQAFNPNYFINERNKEEFFESLGLPGNLSRHSVQNFNYIPSNDSKLNASQNQQMMAPNILETTPFSMDGRSQFMNPSTQQIYKSMFGQQYGNSQEQLVKQYLPGDYASSGEITTQGNELNNSNQLMIPKDVYQTAQFKPGFSNTFYPNKTLPNEILTITIEIGPDQNEIISIKEGDDPLQLAHDFSRKHGISSDLEELLAEQIRLNIDQVKHQSSSPEKENVQPLINRDEMTADFRQGANIQSDPQRSKPPIAPIHHKGQASEMSLNHVFYDERMDQLSNSNMASVVSRPYHSKMGSTTFEPNSNNQMPDKVQQSKSGENQMRTIQPLQDETAPSYFLPTHLQTLQFQSNQNHLQTLQNIPHQSTLQGTQSSGLKDKLQNQLSTNRSNAPILVNTSSRDQLPILSNTMGSNNGGMLVDPNSQAYKNWYQGVSQNLSNMGTGVTTQNYNFMHTQAIAGLVQTNGSNKKPPQAPKIQIPMSASEMQDKPFISDNSKKIIEQKRLGNTNQTYNNETNIHNRLYQDALAKQKATKNKLLNESNASQSNYSFARGERNSWAHMQRSHSAHNIIERRQKASARKVGSLNSTSKISNRTLSQNYGHKLYEQGVKRKEEMKHLIQRAKSEQDRQELEQLSFMPQINKFSRNIINKRKERTEDLLINYGKQVKEKREEQRIENLRKEVEGLSFKPKVCKQSSNIVFQKRSFSNDCGQSKFNSLYVDACRRQERQDLIYSACIDAECTFQPDIEKTRFYNAKQLKDSNASSVFERLSHRINSHNDRSKLMMLHSKNLSKDLFDPETGQELFKPKVGRGPRGMARANYKPGEDLYKAAYRSKERKEVMRQLQEKQARDDAQRIHSKKLTNKIVNQNKLKTFVQIFNELDSDGDGQISAFRINITTLDPQLLQILSPLFIEMEELGISLNQEEFVDAADRLYKAISLPDKNVLVKTTRSNKDTFHQSQEMFKPQINPMSRKLANQRRDKDVSERLYSQHNEYLIKRQMQKEQQRNSELLGCTFKPNLSLTTNQGTLDKFQVQLAKYNYLNTGERGLDHQQLENSIEGFDLSNQQNTYKQPLIIPKQEVSKLAQEMVNNVLLQNTKTPNENTYLLPLQFKQTLNHQGSVKHTFLNDSTTGNDVSSSNPTVNANTRESILANQNVDQSLVMMSNMPDVSKMNVHQFLLSNPKHSVRDLQNNVISSSNAHSTAKHTNADHSRQLSLGSTNKHQFQFKGSQQIASVKSNKNQGTDQQLILNQNGMIVFNNDFKRMSAQDQVRMGKTEQQATPISSETYLA